jgi:HSP20 family protein
MSLIRYNTANDFVPFGTLIDRFFNDTLARSGGSAYSFVPKVDILENEKAFEIQLAVPGMNKEDFKLDLNENTLTVSGERKLARERNETNYRTIETQYGAFSRSFVLPETINSGAITAKYDSGILAVTLPKDEKKTLKTTIKVN